MLSDMVDPETAEDKARIEQHLSCFETWAGNIGLGDSLRQRLRSRLERQLRHYGPDNHLRMTDEELVAEEEAEYLDVFGFRFLWYSRMLHKGMPTERAFAGSCPEFVAYFEDALALLRG